jgi:hypothetical protein
MPLSSISRSLATARRRASRRPPLRILALALALTFAQPAAALVYTVGFAGSCTHPTLAAALAAAETRAGADTIRLTRGGTYSQQAISFGTSDELTITGGYASCVTNTEDDTKTVLDGAGGAAAPVMRITVNTGGSVHLRKLSISGGDVGGDGRGGGIRFEGNGILQVTDSTISGNTAGYGGGVSALGTGESAELLIGNNTSITSNVARYNGGGLYIRDIEASVHGDPIWISNNEAQSVSGSGGYGGGISILSCDRDSIVYLGSPGLLAAGVVSNNSARYGGGVSIEAPCDDAVADLRVYSIDATRLTEIEANVASLAGGAVYAKPYRDGVLLRFSSAQVHVWNANILDNTAPMGAAFHLAADDDFGADLHMNRYDEEFMPALPLGALRCPFGRSCGRIAGNKGAGRVLGGDGGNQVYLDAVEITGNSGSELVRLEHARIRDSLIAGNTVAARLIETDSLDISDTTIAGNTIGAQHTISVTQSPVIDHVIHWQPGQIGLSFANDVDPARVHDIIANEIGSFIDNGNNPGVVTADPRFVDPARGDYSLTAASPAVDFAAALGAAADQQDDLHRHNRSIDLPIVVNRDGPRDLGALEREYLDPLLYNGDFALDLNHWKGLGESAFDATQNAPDSSGGSVKLTLFTDPKRMTGRSQCFWLPGPADYLLNGSGRVHSGGPFGSNRVRLEWELRHADIGECGDGAAATSGSHTLATGPTWTRPATPATITVGEQEWTRNTSLTVKLVLDGGLDTPSGWFDRITLTATQSAPGDLPFADGFESP